MGGRIHCQIHCQIHPQFIQHQLWRHMNKGGSVGITNRKALCSINCNFISSSCSAICSRSSWGSSPQASSAAEAASSSTSSGIVSGKAALPSPVATFHFYCGIIYSGGGLSVSASPLPPSSSLLPRGMLGTATFYGQKTYFPYPWSCVKYHL